MSKTCILTGGSGFIGTHLLQSLLQQETYEIIHVLDFDPPKVEHPSIVYHQCDIREPIELEIEAPGGICYHLAARSKEPGFDWEEYFRTNHEGTIHVLDLCDRAGIRNLIFTSTMMVFKAGDERMLEESLTAPDTAYGSSKLLAEKEVQRWAAAGEDRRFRIVRPAVVFGKGENGNFTRLYEALKKGYFFYIGRDTTLKSNVYVKDVVRFLLFLTNDSHGRELYNMAINVPHSIGHISKTFLKVFSIKRRVFTIPYQLALMAGYFFEWLNDLKIFRSSVHHRRIEKLYNSTYIAADAMIDSGFEPEFSLEEALEDWKQDCAPEEIY